MGIEIVTAKCGACGKELSLPLFVAKKLTSVWCFGYKNGKLCGHNMIANFKEALDGKA